jgi:hypothetical protein
MEYGPGALRHVEVKDWKNTSQHYKLDHMSTTLGKWFQRNVGVVELLRKKPKKYLILLCIWIISN